MATTPDIPVHGSEIASTHWYSRFIEPKVYGVRSSLESGSGMTMWRQMPYPSDLDFAQLAVSLVERQVGLGHEIEAILAAHMNELYE